MDGDYVDFFPTLGITQISIHAAHMDGDYVDFFPTLGITQISIHAAHMDGDFRPWSRTPGNCHFNPRRPYGRRRAHKRRVGCYPNFNPRRPYGRRHKSSRSSTKRPKFQSTPPIWTATLFQDCFNRTRVISIHAAHMDGDTIYASQSWFAYISIHAAHMDGDSCILDIGPRLTHFNPRRPYGRRLRGTLSHVYTWCISIHAAHMDGD